MVRVEGTCICWVAHPLKRGGWRAAVAILIVPAVAAGAYVFFQDTFLAVLGSFILIFSLNSYFFPTTYRLHKDILEVKNIFGTQEYPLSRFQKVILEQNGIYLQAASKSSISESFRSLFLNVEKEDAGVVYEAVKKFIESSSR